MSSISTLFEKSLHEQFPDLPWQQTHICGPKIAVQVDHDGHPIQRYLTAMVTHVQRGNFFVRQIIDLPDETAHPMTLTAVSPHAAQCWLAENGFTKPKPRNAED